jgi:DNA-binding winged helix-turn-helix (wHTH) protein/TolB-like protein/Tfp pilus assembly protein PilF
VGQSSGTPPIKPPIPRVYQFGPLCLDTAERCLFRDGLPVALTPKTFQVLLVLVESGGRTVDKDELINRVWAGSFVEEGNLKVTVSMLRKALGDGTNGQYIETLPRRGYRFIPPVRQLDDEEARLVRRPAVPSSPTVPLDDAALGPDARAQAAFRRVRLSLGFACVATVGLAISGYVLWKTPAADGPTQSIAVLPFKPLAAGSRDEPLEMGMADTLITRLSGLRHLDVRPLSAVRKYSDLDQDALAAGREQKVDAVLDGSIQRDGDRIRVTVRLASTADGGQRWSAQFDASAADIFAVEDSISRQVASALALQLAGGESELLVKHYTADPEAHNLFLKGRYLWNKRTSDAIDRSIQYFEEAVAKDPVYALAYVGLADAYLVLPNFSDVPPADVVSKAKTAVEHALSIDRQLPEAHTTLAEISADFEWNWGEAESQFKQAIAMKPNYATAHQWYGEYLDHAGRSEEAVRELQRAQELDPLSPIINTSLGQAWYHARAYDRSIDQFRKTLDLDPDFVNAHLHLGLIYLQKRMHDEAIAEFQRADALSGDATNVVALLGAAYAQAGKHNDTEKVVDRLNSLYKERRANDRDMAILYTGLGDRDRAIAALEKAYRDHSWLLLLIKTDPYFDPLRNDVRFQDLLNRVRL